MNNTIYKKRIVDFLFPKRCPVCGDILKDNELCCPGCEDVFTYIRKPFCEVCGRRMKNREDDDKAYAEYESDEKKERENRFRSFTPTFDRRRILCPQCASKVRRFAACRCLAVYNEPAREIISRIKYQYEKDCVDFLASLVAEELGGWILSKRPDVIVSVPVHSKRLSFRGFNQAQVLAVGIGQRLQIPVKDNWLERNKNTVASKQLGARERLLNMQRAFLSTNEVENGSVVMLVDDIFTTGTTLEACTEALLGAGVRAVYAVCVFASEDVYE